MSTIQTTRDLNTMFEDMIKSALFPPDSAYVTFTAGEYAAASRAQGRRHFVFFKDAGLYPVIGWYVDGVDYGGNTSQSYLVKGECTIIFGIQNESLHTAAQEAARDIGKAEEALKKQTSATALSYGAFYMDYPGAVSGTAGTIYGVLEPVFGSPIIRPEPALGADIVIGVLPVTISVLMD
jgi:uncharacterized protein YaaQ